nr:MAG: putative RNA dependent RNA polymerase [Inner Mongolia sediment mitovirus 2]
MKLKITRNHLIRKVEAVGFLHPRMFWSFCRLLIWSLRLDKRSYMLLAKRIHHLGYFSGTQFQVKYLKEAYLIVQKFVSGQNMNVSSYPIGIVAGLPSIIPGNLRLLLRRRDPVAIRGCLAFLSIFRILKVPTVLKLQTITDPFKGISESLPALEIGRVFKSLRHWRFKTKEPLEFLRLNTAGPNGHAPNIFNLYKDLGAWYASPLRPSLERFITLLEGPASPFLARCQIAWNEPRFKTGNLGKLAVKEEAAGKARVFAIADLITQSVMHPLHKFLFSILKTIPTDGTFDQGAPLDRLLKLKKDGELGDHSFHSYDLSAATDRLPIKLQRDILGYYTGSEIADLWAKLLTDRDWIFQDSIPIRYSVGQPMGALSSWGMLALTHHYIILVAARRVGIFDFNHYAVLGDDVVIANDLVAASYHSLVTEWLGVDINLQKSLESRECFEFAKRLVTTEGEVTPPGPKNVLLALKSISGIPSLLLDLVNKGWLITEEEADAYLERVPSVRRKSALKELLWCVKGPFGFIPTASGLSSSMRLNSSQLAIELDSLLTSIDDALGEVKYKHWSTYVEKSHKVLSQISERLANWELNYGPLPLFRYIYTLYEKDFMELVLAMPSHRSLQLYAPLDPQERYPDDWVPRAMKEIQSQIREEDDHPVAPISNPFVVEKVSLPFQTSVKSVNFFQEVRRIDKARVIREYSYPLIARRPRPRPKAEFIAPGPYAYPLW